jgi:hypothetical protein
MTTTTPSGSTHSISTKPPSNHRAGKRRAKLIDRIQVATLGVYEFDVGDALCLADEIVDAVINTLRRQSPGTSRLDLDLKLADLKRDIACIVAREIDGLGDVRHAVELIVDELTGGLS